VSDAAEEDRRSNGWSGELAAMVGAVIVHYHREREVAELVANLVEVQGLPITNIVLIDNGSSDGLLQAEIDRVGHHPGLVSLPNVGFAAAMNVGVQMLPESIQYLVLMSHEVVLEAGCVRELVAQLQETPWALVGPILTLDGSTVWSAGGLLTRVRALPCHRLRGRTVDDVPDRLDDCIWLDGAVTATTRLLLEELGGFDEDYFLYMEDVDLGLRAHEASAHVLVVPRARAQQSPSAEMDPYIWTRNPFLLFRKHHRPGAQVLWFLSCGAGILRDLIRGKSRCEISSRILAVRSGMSGRSGPPLRRQIGD
jgi:GT2 family glycosyltransferase